MKAINKLVDNYSFDVKAVSYGKDVEYVVRFIDSPNIIGAGKTPQDAISEARENLSVYFEYCEEKHIQIPSPTIFDGDIEPSGKMTFRTSKSVHRLIIDRAEKEGVSINSFLNDAVHYYLEKRDIKDIINEFNGKSHNVTTLNESNSSPQKKKSLKLT